MKLKSNSPAWRAIAMQARDWGYRGELLDFDSVKNFLIDEVGQKSLKIDGETVEIKALTVELSEDQTQALVSEGQAAAPPPQQQQQAPQQAPPPQKAISDDRLAAAVQKALRDAGVDLAEGKRPKTPEVKNLGTVEDNLYLERVEAGKAKIKDPQVAKAFAHLAAGDAYRGRGDTARAQEHYEAISKIAERKDIDPRGIRSKIISSTTMTKANATTPGSAGGALTEYLFEPEMIRLVEDFGVVPRIMDIRETSEQTVILKRRTGGVTVYHPGENQAATESSPTWDNVSLVMKEAVILTQASRSVLKFASPDIGDQIATEHAQAIAEYIDYSVLGGDGSGGPSGFNQATLPNRVGLYPSFGSTIGDAGRNVTGGDTTEAHTATDLSTLLGRLASNARKGAIILGSKEKLAAGFDRLARAQGGVTMAEFTGFGMVNTWARIPLIEHFGDINGTEVSGGSPGDQVDYIYLNPNLAGKIYRASGMEFDMSDQRYFDQNAVAFRTVMNWDFVWHDLGSTTATDYQTAIALWQT